MLRVISTTNDERMLIRFIFVSMLIYHHFRYLIQVKEKISPQGLTHLGYFLFRFDNQFYFSSSS